jgi:hypothetical protein
MTTTQRVLAGKLAFTEHWKGLWEKMTATANLALDR